MATTTPNFGWPVPTSSDLVKNGATAIEGLGDAIDASLLDLKGGTTGQVLAKASGTDMDFVWAADSAGAASLGYAAGKNKIINGDFYINQRNFTSNTATGSFNFDRWKQIQSGGTFTLTPQTFTPGAAPVAGYEGKTFLQGITASQSAAGDYAVFSQTIEDVRNFAGQTITVSFWAKAATGTPKIGIEIGQNFGSGGSASVFTAGGAVTLSTSFARYSVTIAVPSISGKTVSAANDTMLELFMWVSAGSTFASRASSIGIQNATISIWGIQVEAGSVATAFQTATGTLQGELAACQRYYQVIGGTINQPIYNAYNLANEFIQLPQNFPVQMRVTPTATKTGTWTVANCSQPSAVNPTVYGYALQTQKNGSSGVFYFYPDSSDDLITFSAEL